MSLPTKSLNGCSNVRRDVPLAPYTTMGVGGPADYFLEPSSVEELISFGRALRDANLPLKILGGGSNLLVSDLGVRGGVARLSGPPFDTLEIADEKLNVGAGVSLGKLLAKTAEAGLSGFEGLAGIPGAVGGALIMNAGGKNGHISDHLACVNVLDRNFNLLKLNKEEAQFSYRHSALRDYIVLGAEYILERKSPEEIRQRIKEFLAEKKAVQPVNKKSAGCVFKNPENISAGILIDRSGLKGHPCGGAAISSLHANFIVNEGGATCEQIFELIDLIKTTVKAKQNVDLETEVEIWGEHDNK